MRMTASALLGYVFFVLSPAATAQTELLDRRCGELAASPYDPQRVGNGVPIDQINTREAVPVCEEAVRRLPGSARLHYQLGRALEAANRPTDARQHYAVARQ